MKNMLRSIKSRLGTLILTVFVLCLTACTVDQKAAEEPPEINTFNAYIDGSSIKHVVLVDDEVNIQTLADYSTALEGFSLSVEVNTDEDKQGYEYAVYVKGFPSNENKNELHILHYDKSDLGRTTLMSTITGTICGIKPKFMPSSFAFTDRTSSDRALKNAPEVVIAVAESDELCLDEEEVFYEEISFENYLLATEEQDEETASDEIISPNDYFKRKIITRYQANATLIIDYSSSADRSYGYLSNNPFAGLEFDYYVGGEWQNWRSDAIMAELDIKQPSNQEVLIYNPNGELRVISVATLFSVGNLTDSVDIDTPINKQVNAIFELPLATISGGGNLVSTNSQSLRDVFTLNINNELYFFNRDSTIDPPLIKLTNDSFPSTGRIIESHEIFMEEHVIATIRTTDNSVQAVHYSPESSAGTIVSSMFEGNQADRMEFILNGDNLYVNTLNLISSEDMSDWKTHTLSIQDGNFTYSTFDFNNRLLSLPQLNDLNNMLVLLSFDTAPRGHRDEDIVSLSSELLIKFDPARVHGRYLAASEKSKSPDADFIFGSFNTIDFLDFDYSGTVINDEFARLYLSNENSTDADPSFENVLYIFNPDQDIPDPRFSEQSLKLVSNI